jgi:hypothetical protein
MSEPFTRITFSATTDRRSIPDGFVLTKGETEQLREYLATKNFPPEKHILHISHDITGNHINPNK